MDSEKKLAVLYIITKLELGGAQKICLSLFDSVSQQDIPTFLISGAEGKLVEKIQGKDQVVLLESFTREISWKSLVGELKNFKTLASKIRNLKKQYPHLIVHTHSTKAGIIGRWAAFLAGVKYRVHTVHGFAFHAYQSRAYWWMVYGAELISSFITTHFVCVSSADVVIGKKLFPRFARKHSVIRAAVDTERFYIPARLDTSPEPQTFIFGTVACFKPQKNMFDLLRAFHYVHQKYPHIRLEIVGDGVQRSRIEQWIEEHHMQDIIILHGWQEHVAHLMMQWHGFVLSSLWEGLPCAVVEARLLQLPVIAYDTGGIRDVIVHGKNGFLCKKQWQDLAQAMLNVCLNKKLYTSLQRYPDQLEQFEQAAMISQHVALYKNFIRL